MKRIKKFWKENRVLFVLFVIILICLILVLGVFLKYFFGSSKTSYGNRLDGINEVEVTDDIKNNYISKMKEDELINDVTMKVHGKIIYISLYFKNEASLVEAQSKALASLTNFEDNYLAFYDISFTLKCDATESSEGFLIMGAKNANGSGLVWNNNTIVNKE